jgi:uncharacterized coiled-coil DUF342 family protein
MVSEKTAELLKEIQAEYGFVDNVANAAKTERDRLNEIVKTHADRLKALNHNAKLLKQAAISHMDLRNSLNERVKEGKILRDQMNVAANAAQDELSSIRNRLMPADNSLLNQLKRDFKVCEKRQMTSVLSQDSELKLVTTINRINSQIGQIEEKLNANPDIKAALDKFKSTRQEAELQHAIVSGLAYDAQNAHAMMVGMFSKRDILAKEADDVHNLMMKIKNLADEEHKKFIKYALQARILRLAVHLINTRKGKITSDDTVITKLLQGAKIGFSEMAIVQKAEKKKQKKKGKK